MTVAPPPVSKSYSYDTLGNILTKTGITGTYQYGQSHAQCSNNSGPHAVTTAGGQQFCYDANGNMTEGYNFTRQRSRTLTWTSYNKPRSISEGAGAVTLDFYYDDARARFKQVNSTGLTTIYVGSLYEKQITAGQTTHVHYVRAGGSSIAIYREHDDNTIETRYIHRDHIGSITEITDENAVLAEELSYDPHGKRREIDWQDALTQVEAIETKRCFTGHEYLDDVSLIHMNGRIYDPDLGRFLSPDPFIQEPANAQSLNRYSYVLNNPLSFTDPSGFFFGKLFKAIGGIFKSVFKAIRSVVRAIAKNIRAIGAIAAAVGGYYLCGPACAGFAQGFVSSGGDLQSGLIGAVTGQAFAIVGGLDFTAFGELAFAAKAVAHGVVGGISSVAQGGDFLSGFAAAGTAQFLGGSKFVSRLSPVSQGIARAVAGGAAAVVGGGKFMNGAVTAAFAYVASEVGAEQAFRNSEAGKLGLTRNQYASMVADLTYIGPNTLATNWPNLAFGIVDFTFAFGEAVGGVGLLLVGTAAGVMAWPAFIVWGGVAVYGTIGMYNSNMQMFSAVDGVYRAGFFEGTGGYLFGEQGTQFGATVDLVTGARPAAVLSGSITSASDLYQVASGVNTLGKAFGEAR